MVAFALDWATERLRALDLQFTIVELAPPGEAPATEGPVLTVSPELGELRTVPARELRGCGGTSRLH